MQRLTESLRGSLTPSLRFVCFITYCVLHVVTASSSCTSVGHKSHFIICHLIQINYPLIAFRISRRRRRSALRVLVHSKASIRKRGRGLTLKLAKRLWFRQSKESSFRHSKRSRMPPMENRVLMELIDCA